MGFGLFQSIRRVATGTVIHKTDVSIMNGVATVSLRIKRQKDGNPYVVMACLATGNYQYYAMDIDEFRAVSAAVAETRNTIEKLTISD